MKIVDFKKKGNVVRFYLGKDDLIDWYGDDWDDRPYEHNAEEVHDEFISGTIDVFFPFDWEVVDPSDDWHYGGNSPYCKDDFVVRKAPCIIALPPEISDGYWEICYSEQLGNDKAFKFYFGDIIDDNIPNPTLFEGDYHELKIKKFGLIE